MADNEIRVVNPGSVANALGGKLPQGGKDLGDGVAAEFVEIVDDSGNPIDTAPSHSVTTSVNASATSAQLVAARAGRQALIVYNSSTTVNGYLAEGQAASIAAQGYTYVVPPGGTLEIVGKVFSGVYNYISDSADGSYMNVTERY